jgi:hypothetical protein
MEIQVKIGSQLRVLGNKSNMPSLPFHGRCRKVLHTHLGTIHPRAVAIAKTMMVFRR